MPTIKDIPARVESANFRDFTSDPAKVGLDLNVRTASRFAGTLRLAVVLSGRVFRICFRPKMRANEADPVGLTTPLTPALSRCRNDAVEPRMNTDEHGFSAMIFVVLLPWADSAIGDRFGFQQRVLFICVHPWLKLLLTTSFRPRDEIKTESPFIGY
jgi:hypothetical protein